MFLETSAARTQDGDMPVRCASDNDLLMASAKNQIIILILLSVRRKTIQNVKSLRSHCSSVLMQTSNISPAPPPLPHPKRKKIQMWARLLDELYVGWLWNFPYLGLFVYFPLDWWMLGKLKILFLNLIGKIFFRVPSVLDLHLNIAEINLYTSEILDYQIPIM